MFSRQHTGRNTKKCYLYHFVSFSLPRSQPYRPDIPKHQTETVRLIVFSQRVCSSSTSPCISMKMMQSSALPSSPWWHQAVHSHTTLIHQLLFCSVFSSSCLPCCILKAGHNWVRAEIACSEYVCVCAKERHLCFTLHHKVHTDVN